MAYAGALFADACLRGLNGEPNVEEFTYVESSVVPELAFFSSRVRLGPNGAAPLPAVRHGSHALYSLKGSPGGATS